MVRRVVAAVILLLSLWAPPAVAFDGFAAHEVTVHFAGPDGKAMANAEVQVFAPGQSDRPALTGHTDENGKFEFPANRDGFWSAEARSGGEIAHIMVRVGGGKKQPLSPVWLLGGLFLLLLLAIGYRIYRARAGRPRP